MWSIQFAEEFEAEFGQMDSGLQDELLAQLLVLERFGPGLGRPRVDSLYDSKHSNM